MSESRYLYVLEDAKTKMVKIGSSVNPNRRIKSLELSGNFVTGRRELFGPFRNARLLEKYLHKLFYLQRMSGEWFDIDFGDYISGISNLSYKVYGDHGSMKEYMRKTGVSVNPTIKRNFNKDRTYKHAVIETEKKKPLRKKVGRKLNKLQKTILDHIEKHGKYEYLVDGKSKPGMSVFLRLANMGFIAQSGSPKRCKVDGKNHTTIIWVRK